MNMHPDLISLVSTAPLEGLTQVGFQVHADVPNADSTIVESVVGRLRERVKETVQANGLTIVDDANFMPAFHLFINLNEAVDCVSGIPFYLYRIELVLRELVSLARDSQRSVVSDTWRTKSVVGHVAVSHGLRSLEAAVLAEVERHRKTLANSLNAEFSGHTPGNSAFDAPVAVDSSRVTKAKDLLAAAKDYPKGCNEFVCEVLGIAWEDANSLMGATPTYVGDNNNYPGLVPGDIVGWKVAGGNGHVAVYIGEAGTRFIDVRNPGAKPRKVVNGYGSGRAVFKSSKY